MPTGSIKRGFGFNRVKNIMVSSSPEFMEDNVSTNQKLTFVFKNVISFKNTKNRKIRLQKYGNPKILWTKDFNENSIFEGQKKIIFTDFPTLEPNTHYYITWDSNWVKINQNGNLTPIQPVRESAFAYRFKTRSK
ncbi:Ig-like domain-containing protein [uncultured Polaribacter sp.]|uniref:Ig-like domain-containing protein n=1 Tax=uncultured Polaribacter sp. TaxID=174711 RepID=UPI0026297A24|nr:Ig-like domain-containing protein [uncultured Polaribacter sp.]